MRSESDLGLIKLAHTFYEPQDGLAKRKRRFRVIYSCARETRENRPNSRNEGSRESWAFWPAASCSKRNDSWIRIARFDVYPLRLMVVAYPIFGEAARC